MVRKTRLISYLKVGLFVSFYSLASLSFSQEIDLFSLSLEELSNIRIESSSAFLDTAQDAAATVSVVSREEWQQWGAKNLYDSVNHLPGVVIMSTFVGSYTPKIRGYASALPRGIATVIDGVSVNDYGYKTASYTHSFMSLDVLDKVELARGPGSVSYGTDAFHGVMSLSTFDSAENMSEVDVSLGNDGYQSLTLRNAIHQGNWHTAVALNSSNSNGGEQWFNYTDPDSLVEENGRWSRDYDQMSAVAKLRYNDGSEYSNTYYINGYFVDAEHNDFPGLGRLRGGLTNSNLKENDSYSNDSRFLMVKTGYSQYVLDQYAHLSVDAHTWETGRKSERYTAYDVIATGDIDTKVWGVQANLTHESETENFNWAVSIGHTDSKIVDSDNTTFNETTEAVSSSKSSTSGLVEAVDFATVQIKHYLFERELLLQYGFRYDNYDTFGTNASPRLAIIYKPSDNNTFKMLYGNAYRSTSAGEQTGTSITKGSKSLSPEIIDTYELVYMYQTSQWLMEAIVFYSQFKDGIESVPSSDPNYRNEYANVGKSKSKGVELRFEAQIKQNWLLDTSMSYVNSENIVTGEDYAAFPEWTFAASIGYSVNDNVSLYFTNRVLMGMNENPSVASKKLPTYWQTHLTLNYSHSDNLQFTMGVDNLFDRDNKMPALLYQENGLPSEGKTIQIGLNYRFN